MPFKHLHFLKGTIQNSYVLHTFGALKLIRAQLAMLHRKLKGLTLILTYMFNIYVFYIHMY